MRHVQPHHSGFTKEILRVFTAVFVFALSLGAQDLSKYNLTPDQVAKFSALDSQTQQKVLDELEKRGAPANATPTADNHLNKDQIATPSTPASPAEATKPAPETHTSEKVMLFGYAIFTNGNTFAPTIQIATPIDYVMGPGDVVDISLYGKRDDKFELTVTREGNLEIPNIGVVPVAGSTFIDARNDILRRIKTQLIGVEGSVTMGELRSIRIYVMGEVDKPGSYAVSSLATITNALFVCGGIRETGSLR